MTADAGPAAGIRKRAVRFGLWTAAGVGAFLALVDGVLRPLHSAGSLQGPLDYLNGLGAIVQNPGWGTYRIAGTRLGYSIGFTAWAIVFALNLVYYFLAGFALRLFWEWAGRPRSGPGGSTTAGQGLSRRRFLKTGVKVAAGGAAAAAGYGLLIESRRLDVIDVPLRLRGLPPELEGLRAVQITDVHHGPFLSLARVRAVVDAANELRPDLVLLTGDYVHASDAYIRPVVAELARLRPKIGTLAVLGNHDWLEGVEQTREEFVRWGIPLIDNDRRVLTPDRRLVGAAPVGLAICGVGDYKEDQPDYRKALSGLPEGMPRVLLSHNPDAAEEPELTGSGLRVDLIVSGHTHGGQVCLPLVGAPVIHSRYRQKYRRGLVAGPICPVFVCSGVGTIGVPVRFGVPPELAVLEFRAARSPA
jgi:predicted MPP superfamily phosphohydrolase